MEQLSAVKLGKLVILGIFSIFISFMYGVDGIEVFLALHLLTGILLAYYAFELVKLLFNSKVWLIIKLFGLVVAGFSLFFSFGIVIIPFSNVESSSSNTYLQTLNWGVLLIILVSYLFNRFILDRKNGLTSYQLSVNAVSTILSLGVMFAAFSFFVSSESLLKNLVLVIAIELQFIANYVYTQTNYLEMVHKRIIQTNFYRRLGGDLQLGVLVTILGLPTLLSLLIIALSGVVLT